MIKRQDRVAVTSRSFSKNPILRAELLERYENVTFNDEGLSLSGEALVDFLGGHSKAITALEKLDKSVIARLSDLRVLSKYGVGIDMIDVPALKKRGIGFGWTKGVNRRSVSELTLSFLISLLHHVPVAQRDVQDGFWRQHIGATLTGKTVGIIGCGNVGKDLIRLLQPFGCRILIHDLIQMSDFAGAFDCTETDLQTLLATADAVTLHLPLDETTRGLIGDREIAQMKPGAVIINTARGGIIDESSLLAALNRDHLVGVALDVFAIEPPETDTTMALINHPKALITPHIGGSAAEAILAMGRAAIQGLDHYEK